MASSSTQLNLDVERAPLTMDHLLDEYQDWQKTADRDSDDFGALAKLAALYRFAIIHHAQPGGEMLMAAIRAVEAAGKDD